LGGHGDILRGSRGDAAGTELGSSFVERITANVGTVSILACLHAPSMAGRLGPSSTDRVGTGRSRRCDTRSHVVSEHTDGGSTMTKV
jgi:hypothetical protein